MVRASENGGGGGGGGRITIGSTGKVSALMMQELESNLKTSSKKIRIQTPPVSISCGASSTKRLQRMMSSGGGGGRRPEKKTATEIPMLESEDLWVDKTPIRGKERKKVAKRIVETVDLKCGAKHEGDNWLINPISNQLRRLSFSKISD